MARARNIKPALFKNELLGVADPLLTILFAGLWCLADRAGRLEDRPLRIKAEIFPYRDLPLFNGYLTELQRLGFIYRYLAEELPVIQIVNFAKHQNPHKTERLSDLPEFQGISVSCSITDKEPLSNGELTEAARLIPDSLLLIPDIGFPLTDSLKLTTDSSGGATPPPRAKAKTGPVWDAYSKAYLDRYGTAPLRNATVNGQLAQFVSRIGEESAPAVASFYVGHNDRFYVQKQHSVGLMLQNAEGLHTQWASGRSVTQTGARQIESKQANLDTHNEALAILRGKGYQ